MQLEASTQIGYIYLVIQQVETGAPRMADHFAAAAMMAGHPNDASPLGLRNLPFSLQVGENDSRHNRNDVAKEWQQILDNLHNNDKNGYINMVKIHEGKEHWMDGLDRIAIQWMQNFTRTSIPQRIVWKQSSTLHSQFYWLATSSPKSGALVIAERNDQTFTIQTAEQLSELTIFLNDDMLDLAELVLTVCMI